MATIIILIVILIFALVMIPFMRQIAKDKIELERNPIDKKFSVLVGIINQELMGGKGEVVLFDDDKRLMNLFSEDSRNMLIQFFYSTGNLTIILNYKYFHNELVYKQQYNNLRNISLFQQKSIANDFLDKCIQKISEHKQKVGFGDLQTVDNTASLNEESDPTGILAAPFMALSLSQRMSVVNLMYLIASAAHISEKQFLMLSPVSQQLLITNLHWEDCKKQYLSSGREQLINDLSTIPVSTMAMIIMSAFQINHELLQTDLTDDDYSNLNDTFFQTFEDLGYPEERLKNIMQKLLLLQQKFG